MDDIYIGSICLFAFNFVPYGFHLCDGTELNQQQNAALYSLIGQKYGGTSTTFRLPDLSNAAPFATMKYYICINGIYPSKV